MNQLQEFIRLLEGDFDNRYQIEQAEKDGIKDFPFARHRNTVCNDKIIDLPQNFQGIFLLEESYYTVKGRTNAMPHLFLFTEEASEDGKIQIKLTSYEMPEGYTKDTFRREQLNQIDYASLKQSPTFTPAFYQKKGDCWEGGSISHFSPVLTFSLWESFSEEKLLVSEVMERDGKRIFGYDIPLEYRRI